VTPRVILSLPMPNEVGDTLHRIDQARLALAKDVDHLLDRLAPLSDRIDAAAGNETVRTMLRECREAVVRFVQESTIDFTPPLQDVTPAVPGVQGATVAVVCDPLTRGVRIDYSHAARSWAMTAKQARTVGYALVTSADLLEGTAEDAEGVH
jgi:hypothetical protein